MRHPIQLLSRGNQTPSALAKTAGTSKGPVVDEAASIAAASVPANQLQLAAAGTTGAAAELNPVESGSFDEQDDSLANTKEKTPMCLINELARFNKIQHQYTLTDEQGPAHKKTFYVNLKLGDEKYAAAGPSIKKAQHAAAKEGLAQSAYKHPPAKTVPSNGLIVSSNPSITPTVELNALAMKRGEPAVYRAIEPNRPYLPPPNLDFRGMYNQRYHYPKYPPRMFYVSLKVGHREFIGEGSTRQTARHSAAEKALKVLKCLPMPGEAPLKKGLDSTDDEDSEKEEEEETKETDQTDDNAGDDNDDDALKSEISLVHEIALRRNLTVTFEVVKESGPPHMRTFITRCTCGTFVVDGVGNSKKLSKKRCAEKMLEQLRTLPSVPPVVSKVRNKMPVNKKKNRNLIKLQKACVEYGVGINPISRLIQIQQAKKEKEPVYSLLAERGLPRRREFVIQVAVGEQTCTGVGPNKKLAKRTAAEQMLQLLGYSRPSPQPQKPAIKTADSVSSGPSDKKVTFQDMESTSSPSVMARQLVPGVLVLPENTSLKFPSTSASNNTSPSTSIPAQGINGFTGENFAQTTAVIAKELLDQGVSPTAEALKKTVEASVGTGGPVNSVHQKRLEYLGKVLGFTVEYSYFFKGIPGGKQEYLSLVSLSTNPPRVYHGSGPDVEVSHNMAALNALRELSEINLEQVQQNGSGDTTSDSKDSIKVKKELL